MFSDVQNSVPLLLSKEAYSRSTSHSPEHAILLYPAQYFIVNVISNKGRGKSGDLAHV